MTSDPINDREREIDKEFNHNALLNIPYSQSMWTILSVMEDQYLKMLYIDNHSSEQIHVHIDVLMNALTHPIRSIYYFNTRAAEPINKTVVDDHYKWGYEWIHRAKVYDLFCSVFPLWRKGKISLYLSEEVLDTSDWRKWRLEYEAYNRLIRKDGIYADKVLNQDEIIDELMANVAFSEHNFKLNLNPRLAKYLIKQYSTVIDNRYNLPEDWACSHFSFGEFKKVYIALQAILYGRFTTRTWLAINGMKGLGYPDAVWVVETLELNTRLSRYTGIKADSVKNVLRYLTFGEVGIRTPDIAIQPIIDLKNKYYALSPFIFLNSNAERNLCVLLNQIEEDRAIYSKLTQQKEGILREKIISEISSFGYDFKSGNIGDTDLDLAIIDRDNKTCIAFELKWFIEPAEIREVIEKSKELEKGVSQARLILRKFQNNDKCLLNDVLNIDKSYRFVVAVGSMNWIGHYDVQSDEIPIIKVGHFLEKLKASRNLSTTIDWLVNREYLPKESVDFEILSMPLELGKWKSSWYGIKPIS